jgi:hypothetical protein
MIPMLLPDRHLIGTSPEKGQMLPFKEHINKHVTNGLLENEIYKLL